MAGPYGPQDPNFPLLDYIGTALKDTGSALVAGVGHTDEVINQMLVDFGVDPATAFMISNPYDSIKRLSAVGIGGEEAPVASALSEEVTPLYQDWVPPQPVAAPPPVAAAGMGLRDRIRAPLQQEFIRPDAPDFSRVEEALGGMVDPTAPVAPTDRDLLIAGLAGAAGGAAQGQTTGQILALAAAGAFNAREMKQTAYEERLQRYEEQRNENARVKAAALAQIETAQAEFDRTVALAENQFNQNAAEQALRHDIADAQDKIAQMSLLQPQFHNLGNGMGAIVTRGPDGSMNVDTVELDPLARKLQAVVASANLQRALRGGTSDKTSVAVKVGGITSTFDQNDPMTPFLTLATVALSNPSDPRAKRAMELAQERILQRYGGADEDGELPKALQMYQTLKPDEYSAELESMATLIYATGLMAEQGQAGEPK